MTVKYTDVRKLTGILEIPYFTGGPILVPSVNIWGTAYGVPNGSAIGDCLISVF